MRCCFPLHGWLVAQPWRLLRSDINLGGVAARSTLATEQVGNTPWRVAGRSTLTSDTLICSLPCRRRREGWSLTPCTARGACVAVALWALGHVVPGSQSRWSICCTHALIQKDTMANESLVLPFPLVCLRCRKTFSFWFRDPDHKTETRIRHGRSVRISRVHLEVRRTDLVFF